MENNEEVKVKRKKVLDEFDDIQKDLTISPSSIYLDNRKKKEEKKKKKKEEESHINQEETDAWFNSLMDIKTKSKRKRKSSGKTLDDLFKGTDSHKKKKKKKEGELTDYKKEFESELQLLRNLLIDQSKFTASLQNKYNVLEEGKSTARGISKFTTDLIANTTQARSLQLQIADKIISLKKSIADLSFKERKEFGDKLNSEITNMSEYASTYLKQMISGNRKELMGDGDLGFIDSEEDALSELDDVLSQGIEEGKLERRSNDAQKLLEYENRNVKIYVVMDENDTSDYSFRAIDEDGNEIYDYPLPPKSKITINKSTGTATTEFGKKYNIIFE